MEGEGGRSGSISGAFSVSQKRKNISLLNGGQKHRKLLHNIEQREI
jgi:hypothetical protein